MQQNKMEAESAFLAAWIAKLFGLRFFDLSTIAKIATETSWYSNECSQITQWTLVLLIFYNHKVLIIMTFCALGYGNKLLWNLRGM